MDTVRLGVIGCGVIARFHMRYYHEVPGLKFVAASDVHQPSLDEVVKQYNVKPFTDADELLASGLVDAVLIATPHYFHPRYAVAAFDHGLHVLTEKPAAVTAGAAAQMNAAHARHPELVYGVMHQFRSIPRLRYVKQLIDSGRLGNLQRIHWTVSDWFRTQAYYDSGGWRATWKGEGGGVLMNQCPHNIDVLYWFFGLPKRVTAKIALGKYHNIEVEDDVTAILEYENGATGVFVTTTGEWPGSNYFEIAGDRGRVSFTPTGPIDLVELEGSTRDFINQSSTRMGSGPAVVRSSVTPPDAAAVPHQRITAAFIEAVLRNDPSLLLAPGDEGIHSVEMINAMIQSGLTGRSVDLPTDRAAYEKILADLSAKSAKK